MRISGSVWGIGAILCGASLVMVGCSSSPDTAHKASSSASSDATTGSSDTPGTPGANLPTTPPKPPVLATGGPAAGTNSNKSDTQGLSVQINSAQRDSGGVVTLTWTLKNDNGETFNTFTDLADFTSKYFGHSVSQVNLIDQKQKLRFYPLIDNQYECSCSSGSSTLEKGHEITLYDQYKVAPTTKTVDVTIKGFQTIKNVPIS